MLCSYLLLFVCTDFFLFSRMCLCLNLFSAQYFFKTHKNFNFYKSRCNVSIQMWCMRAFKLLYLLCFHSLSFPSPPLSVNGLKKVSIEFFFILCWCHKQMRLSLLLHDYGHDDDNLWRNHLNAKQLVHKKLKEFQISKFPLKAQNFFSINLINETSWCEILVELYVRKLCTTFQYYTFCSPAPFIIVLVGHYIQSIAFRARWKSIATIINTFRIRRLGADENNFLKQQKNQHHCCWLLR